MEPIIDYGNKKKAPLVTWTKGSLMSLPSSNTTLDGKSIDESVKSYPPVFNGSENQKLTVNNNCENLVIPESPGENYTDGVKFIDSYGRILNTSSSESLCLSINTASNEVKKPKLPDGGWGWVVVLSSFVISMIADGISFSFGLLYIEFLNYFQESKSKTSWIGSLFMAVPLLSGPVMSALVDRYGCKSMTILGGLISGVGFVIASVGDSIEWELIFFGGVAGIGLGLCYVTAVVSVAYWFDKYRTLAIGIASCGTGVGTFVYAPMTQFFIDEYGWRGTVLLLAGTFFNMCVCGAVMRDPKWLAQDQKKQNDLKSKNPSSCGSTSGAEGDNQSLRKTEGRNSLKSGKISNCVSTTSISLEKLEKENMIDKENPINVPTVRSLINLPTFLKQNEKVSCEVERQLSTNKTIFKFILENYPSLLQCGSFSDKRKFDDFSKDNSKPVSATLLAESKTCSKENNFFQSDVIANNITETPNSEEAFAKKEIVANSTARPTNKSHPMKRTVGCVDSGQHYFRNIKLHRNSVMYRGAMLNIPKYRLRASSCPDIFRNSMTTIAKENEEKWYADVLELFKTMFDFSMFAELHFCLMSLATIILFIWLIIPYLCLAEHLTRHGYTEVEGSILLSIIGVANSIGMVGLGWAGDQPWVNVTKTYSICLIVCGLSCLFMPLTSDNYNALAALSALFGISFASNYSFTPSIVVQLIPLERFTTAYGLILLCQGIGCLVGPPLAGWIFDLTGEWDMSFYMAGAWIIFSGVLIVLIQFTKNRRIWGSGLLEMDRCSNI